MLSNLPTLPRWAQLTLNEVGLYFPNPSSFLPTTPSTSGDNITYFLYEGQTFFWEYCLSLCLNLALKHVWNFVAVYFSHSTSPSSSLWKVSAVSQQILLRLQTIGLAAKCRSSWILQFPPKPNLHMVQVTRMFSMATRSPMLSLLQLSNPDWTWFSCWCGCGGEPIMCWG